MSDYQYINVNQPVLGLMGHIPAPDLPDRACSDCSNVYFWNGEIRKRSGYGAAKTIKLNAVATAGMTQEILCLALFDESIDDDNPTRRLLAITKDYLLDYDAANDWWEYESTGVAHDLNDAAYPSSIVIAAYSKIRKTAGVDNALDDIYFTVTGNSADAYYDVKINATGTPDTFQVAKDGGAYGAAQNCGTDYTDTAVTIGFKATTGHTLNDVWRVKYDYTNRPTVSSVASPAPPAATGMTKCLKITVPAAFKEASYAMQVACFRDKDDTGDIYEGDNIDFWYYHTYAGTNCDFSITEHQKDGIYGCYVAGRSYSSNNLYFVKSYNATIGSATDLVWQHVSYPISATYDVASSVNFSGRNHMVVELSDAFDAEVNLYLSDFRLSSDIGAGFSAAIDTATDPVLTCAAYGTIQSVPGNRLYYTALNAHVRYVDAGASRSSALLDGGDYNTTRTTHRARAVSGYKNRLNLYATIEESSGSDKYHLLRHRWCDLGDMGNWNTGTSGYTDMVDTLDPVENVVMLAGSDYVFKENSIWRITHLGGETGIFQHEAACQTEGLVAPRLLFANENNVIFAGHSNIYTYGGAASLTPIGDAVKDAFFTALNYLDGIYHRRAHCLYFKDKNLLAFLVPAASAYPDKAWVYDLTQQTWTCWNFLNGTSANVTAGCAYWHLTGNTWDHKMQFGSSGGGLYEWDWTGKNDGAAAITAYWDSKEFCNPQKGRTEYTRWRGCHFEATGDSVTVYYSADGGSWTSAGTFTLTSDWARYFADFNIEAQLLKIRFYNNTVSSTFKVRWFDLMWHEGETH